MLSSCALPLQQRRLEKSLGIPGVPQFSPTDCGVVVAARSRLSLVSSDLQVAQWRHEELGKSSGLYVSGSIVFFGPAVAGRKGELVLVRLADGILCGRVRTSEGRVIGGTDRTILIATYARPSAQIVCLDKAKLKEEWRRPAHAQVSAASAGETYLVPTRLGMTLECLHAETGELVWQFEPPGADSSLKPIDRVNRMGPGSPSVAVAGDRVVVTTLEPRVYALSLDNGEVLGVGVPPFSGSLQVTDTSIFFAQPFGLSEFDHREMKEVDRIEYRREVAPLYRLNAPSLHGFVVTDESVVWTTMHGAFMGVSRRPGEDGRRRTWVDEVPGAIMPIGRSPVAHHGYIYYAAMSLGDENVSGLYAYTSSSEE
jgi:hypothetical protein